MNDKDILQSAKLSSQGFELMYDGNLAEAISKFDEALNIFPESLASLQGRALCKTLLTVLLPTQHHHSLLVEIEDDSRTALGSIKSSHR